MILKFMTLFMIKGFFIRSHLHFLGGIVPEWEDFVFERRT